MGTIEIPEIRKMSEEEKKQAIANVAISSPDHLKKWLVSSGREWLVLNSSHLVDALPWPNGISALTQVIAAYRDHRMVLKTGEVENDLPVCYTETLTRTELDRCIRYLIGQITEIDPTWTLERDPE